MRRIYESPAYGEPSNGGNYWLTTASAPEGLAEPLAGEASCDIAIIGGGYTGLSAALRLAGEHGADVAVLEAEHIGWGASGRNGGFCCLGGSKLGQAALVRRYGADDAARFRKVQRAAVDLVAELLERHRIDADTHSHGETLLAHRPGGLAALRREAEEMRATYGLECEVIPPEELAARGMSGPGFHGAMTEPLGFALNPYKYTLGLAGAAQAAGARLYHRSPVTAVSKLHDGRFLLTSPRGRLTAGKLIVATNGYSSEDVPGWMASRYLPVQSNIIVTRPLTPAEQQAQGWTTGQMCYDTRKLLHYFRLMPDGRFLFGMRGGVSASRPALAATRKRIRRHFERMFPEWRHVETPHFWAGLVCMTRDLVPFAGPIPGLDGAFAAYAYHGNGVSMSTWCGHHVADLAVGAKSDQIHPQFLARPPRRYPLGHMRRILLAAAYGWYALKDA